MIRPILLALLLLGCAGGDPETAPARLERGTALPPPGLAVR